MKSALLWLSLASLTFFGLAPQRASAQLGLTVSQFEDDTLRVDGMLREWADARFVEVGTGNDGAMRCALGYDGRGLYVAAEVRDERLIRNAQPGNGDDAVVVTLALPSGRALEGVELWLHPGESGRSSASITSGAIGASRRTAVRGATVVEAPRTGGGGYIIEAFIPFAALRNGTRWQEGRASLRLHDVDSLSHPEAENEPAFAPVDRAHLDLLPSLRAAGGEGSLLEEFQRTHELTGTAPRFDLRGNVTGDADAERVVIVGRFVVATGRAIQQGRGFVFVQLPVDGPSDVREARLEDWTGDGISELIVTMQQQGGGGSRQLTQVIAIEPQAVRPGWAAEVQKQTPQGSVTSTLRVTRGRRGEAPTITIRAGTAQGLDATTLREAPPTDVEAMLLPWGPVLERSYRWDGRAFARVGERANPRYVDPSTVVPSRPATPVATPTAPPAPTLDAVIAGFRQERGLPANARPSRDLSANVVGTAAPERVLLFGSDLVVVGAEFRNGTGWFHYALPAASAADVLDVRLADVTGDARAEILVRVRQAIGDVHREVLLVHQLTVTGFPVILQREVARAQGTNRVENEIRTEGGRLEIGVGTARGYSATTWPFAAGPSTDGVETVLLPWRDRGVTYRFAGGRLVP